MKNFIPENDKTNSTKIAELLKWFSNTVFPWKAFVLILQRLLLFYIGVVLAFITEKLFHLGNVVAQLAVGEEMDWGGSSVQFW